VALNLDPDTEARTADHGQVPADRLGVDLVAIDELPDPAPAGLQVPEDPQYPQSRGRFAAVVGGRRWSAAEHFGAEHVVFFVFV